MKKIFSLFLSVLILFSTVSCVFAENLPTSSPNNIFGIHITDEKDLPDAKNLVNSGGGDWGYVTLVITEGERNHDRWQKVFDDMRRDHLIPIIRIASRPSGDTWEIPQEAEINNWIAFLNSLNWVTQNRYVVISNEPNHATEWGGKVDPAGYAAYLKEFSDKLHSASKDFFVLPAGLDASARNTKDTMEESLFIRKMIAAVPTVFDGIDGWTSHSYPNPDFSGSELAKGKGTIDTFDWELNYLTSLGVTKNFPVFITETGWSNKNLSEDEIDKKLTYAYQNVWNDPRVVAVTPFTLNYPQEPFGQFSWKKSDGSFYNFYSTVQNLPKTKGAPVQIESGQIFLVISQPTVLSGSDFVGAILAKNTGQSIWSQNSISISSDTKDVVLKSYSVNDIEPMRLGLIIFKAASPESTGIYSKSLFLTGTKGQRITNSFFFESLVVKIDSAAIKDWTGKLLKLLRI